MTAEDRLDILEQIGRYSYASDERDLDGLLALFTDDGVFERWLIDSTEPESAFEGRDELRAWAQGIFDSRPEGVQTRHHQRATVFDELGGDTARTRTMLLVTAIGPGDRRPRTAVSGVYDDEWRRAADGWRLARRVVHIDRASRGEARG